MLLLGLDGRDPATPHHRVLFPPSRAAYDAEFDAYRGAEPPAEPAVYVHAPDDPALRPDDDSEAWFVLVTAPRHDPGGGVDWDAPGLAARYAERILALMAERGVDVRHRIRHCAVRTPADLERETLSPGGSIYGTSSDGALAAFLRPANRSPVDGLYLVGGSAHPGGGLPLVTLSAEITARLVRERCSRLSPRTSLTGAHGRSRRRTVTTTWVKPTTARTAATASAIVATGRPGLTSAPTSPSAVTITRDGRSHTLTTPTSGSRAEARTDSWSSVSTPTPAASHPGPPASTSAARNATSPIRSTSGSSTRPTLSRCR
ncbi:phytoene desaturase family protein [Actinomycetospora sp. CA-053990]|uniref:phytoene desaturase family protein n=1 Tax=Actinomycetospora sp. CA-053990 TaxID=3239891 RepID=UPI003D934352